MWILPYKIGSESAKNLAEALGIKRVNKERTKVRGNIKNVLINWGNSQVNHPELVRCTILNRPEAVRRVSNKLTFFTEACNLGARDLLPDWTTKLEEATEWFGHNKNAIVVARTLLTDHSGNGIVLMSSDNPKGWVNAPLYTLYKPKKDEYRIHFGPDNEIIFKQRKAMVVGAENVNFKVRNRANGFIYANQNIETPNEVDRVVKEFLEKTSRMGLDFGAIDVVYNEREDKAYILEINTAPGLSGKTLEVYSNLFRKYLP